MSEHRSTEQTIERTAADDQNVRIREQTFDRVDLMMTTTTTTTTDE